MALCRGRASLSSLPACAASLCRTCLATFQLHECPLLTTAHQRDELLTGVAALLPSLQTNAAPPTERPPFRSAISIDCVHSDA
jgi:hypothetical protein